MRRMKEKIVNMASRASSPDTRNTAKNVVIDVLNIAKDTGGAIPGVSPLFGGILQVVQGIDKSAVNVKTLQKLEENIRSLQSIFFTSTGPDYPPDMHEDVDVLTKALNDSLRKIEEKRSHSRARLFADRNEDEADLQSLAVDIQSALTTFQIGQTVKHRKQERLQEISLLLEKLPFVEDASFDSNQNTHQECFEGTRVEILEQIQQWIEDDSSPPLFWLNGIAGIGKSTIAQSVASLSQRQGVLGANFFFSRMVAEQSNSGRVLPTLAYQLAHYDDQFKSRLVEALKKESDAGSKALTKQMEHLILGPLLGVGKQRKIVIVLDALDECQDKGASQLLQLLLNLANTFPASVRILVTSRPEAHIRAIFNLPSNHTKITLHEVEHSVVESDVNTYVVAKLREIAKDLGLPESPDWFSEADKNELVKRAGKLFIYAATAMLFIGNATVADPHASMKLLLHSDSASDAFDAYQNLDRLYTEVLLQAISGANTTSSRKLVVDRYQEIMGTIVLLRDPLPMVALSKITGGTKSSIQAALRNVHSVIAVFHRDGDEVPTIYHPSFPEFITNPARCQNPDLLIDRSIHERRLAMRCLELLTSRLKRDIVGIHDPSLLNSEVEGLSDRVKKAIPAEMQYACKHWSSHLTSLTSKDTELLELLEAFARESMLFWFEAMSLLDSTSLAVACTKDAHEWMVRVDCGDLLKTLLNDGYRFILAHYEPIKVAALHVYHSALPFTPHETALRNAYQHEMDNTIKVLKGVVPQWSACLNTLVKHMDPVNAVAFSPDGSRLASGSNDRIVFIWDAATGDCVAGLQGHTDSINTVVFSSDGSHLTSSSDDGAVRLWDAATGAHAAMLQGHTDSIAVAFSSDGSRLASSSRDFAVRLWDVATGALVAVLEGHTDSIYAVAFSSDGSRLASGSYDCTVCLWDALTGAQITVLEGHACRVTTVAFSPDGSRLASGSLDGAVFLWDAAKGTLVAVLDGHVGSINTVTFSLDSSQLASGSGDDTVRLWDAARGAQIAVLEGHTGSVDTVTFSSDGSRLASGSNDKTVRLWNAATGAQVAVLEGHTDSVNTVAFSSDGSRLASGSRDCTVRLWDAATVAPMAAPEGHTDSIIALIFSSDGSRLASSSRDLAVRLWDVATGVLVAVLEGHTDLTYAVAFSSDGSRLASGSRDRTVRLWDAATGAQVAVFECHSRVGTVTFSLDGSRLAIGSDDGAVHLWDAAMGALLAVFESEISWITAVAFSSDDSRLASGSADGTVRLWDAATGAQVALLEGHTNGVNIVTFSSDDSRLASGSSDCIVHLWDVATGAQIAVLEGHSYPIDTLAFSTDGLYLISQCWSKLLTWDLYPSPAPTLLTSSNLGDHLPSFTVPFPPHMEHQCLWYFPRPPFSRTRLCYIPGEHQITYHDTISSSQNFVALGCKSGKVLLIDISHHPTTRSTRILS